MAQTARYFKLGVFALASIATLVLLLVLIGSGRFDRNRVPLETYFDESVQGLDVGSKIKYRGVTIGEVTRIAFTSSKYELDKPPTDRKQFVLVEGSIRGELVGGKPFGQTERARLLEPQLERGLRVRLASQGLTGTSYLEVDFVDTKVPALAYDWTPDALYVPSAPSTVTQVLAAVDEIVTRARKVDIESAINNFSSAMETATRQMNALPLDRLANESSGVLRDASALVADLRRTNQRLATTIERLPLDKIERVSTEAVELVAELRQSNAGMKRFFDDPALSRVPADISVAANSIRDTFANPDLSRAVSQLQRSVGRLERLLVGREGDLSTTLENLRVITDQLRDTTELARRYPSQLLLGGPPAPSTSVAP